MLGILEPLGGLGRAASFAERNQPLRCGGRVLGVDAGPIQLHYNPRQDLSKRLGEAAANNTETLVPLLQSMGVDTTHINGLERYNQSSPSKHWGQSNPINVPLPSWLNADPVK